MNQRNLNFLNKHVFNMHSRGNAYSMAKVTVRVASRVVSDRFVLQPKRLTYCALDIGSTASCFC